MSSIKRKVDYTERDSKIGKCQGGAQNLNQATPAPKQPMFKDMGDAGGFEDEAPTLPKTKF